MKKAEAQKLLGKQVSAWTTSRCLLSPRTEIVFKLTEEGQEEKKQ